MLRPPTHHKCRSAMIRFASPARGPFRVHAWRRIRSRAGVRRRPGDAHRPPGGDDPRAHRPHRAIAVPQPAARAADAAPAGGSGPRRRGQGSRRVPLRRTAAARPLSIRRRRTYSQPPAAQTSPPPPAARRRGVAGFARRSRPPPPSGDPPRRRLRSDVPIRTRPARRGQLGTSTAATEPPPPVSDAPAPGPRQIGAPLDLSTPAAPPRRAAGAAAEQSERRPAPCRRRCRRPTRPRTNTISPTATFCTRIMRLPRRRSAASCASIRAISLAPEAQYWLGESLFQQQQYRDAAESFLAVSTKYETTARAPEALLRLGQSLAALGEKEAACASLGEVLRKYPRASSSVKQAVDREQKRGHC